MPIKLNAIQIFNITLHFTTKKVVAWNLDLLQTCYWILCGKGILCYSNKNITCQAFERFIR